MLVKRLMPLFVLLAAVTVVDVQAGDLVPFKGNWTGVTLSDDPTNFPVIAVVSGGDGNITRLGRYTMISPHTTNIFTGETLGDQIFTAANGDTLTAYCAGFPAFQPDGSVAGSLECTFTSGTGRFAGATGGYEFFFIASPRTDGGPGFATVAHITGSISSVGSGNSSN